MYAPSKLSQRNLEKYILVGYDKSNPAKQIIATHITVKQDTSRLFLSYGHSLLHVVTFCYVFSCISMHIHES